MSILDRGLATIGLKRAERADPGLGFNEWLNYYGTFNYGGAAYPFMTGGQTLGAKQEVPRQNFESYIQTIYKQNGIVFACMVARMLLFSEARFQFRRRIGGRPEELFGTPALEVLEKPWTNATTGDLLTRVIQDADLAGNFYGIRRGNAIRRLRPDWVSIIIGSQSQPDDPGWAIDAEVVGYVYQPYGPGSQSDPEVLLPEEVAHFAPIPDPAFRFRGMSWLQPVIGEIMGDGAMTTHKLKFFENGATPNLVVTLDPKIALDQAKFDSFVTKMKEQHEGVLNAYRTLYLANGSTATPVGANMRQIEFKVTQGHGETRVAAAARIPPIIVGLSEGLDAATYSNYGQAKRAFADGTMRPLWRNVAGSFQHLVTLPPGAELWYDDRDIPFLQEDRKDAADILHVNAQATRALIDAGFEPDTVIKAIDSGDLTRLKHSGLYSVQLQTPGSLKMPEQPPVVPGEPKFPELPAPSNKPGETGGPKAIAAPAAKMPMMKASPPRGLALDDDKSNLAVITAELATRDGWTCQLCRAPIDTVLNWPNPGSPTIDHIVPVSLGGGNEFENLRLAHYGCNSRRGNDGENRQRVSIVASARHAAIAERLARGDFHKEIAAELGVSERTVERVAAALRKVADAVV